MIIINTIMIDIYFLLRADSVNINHDSKYITDICDLKVELSEKKIKVFVPVIMAQHDTSKQQGYIVTNVSIVE